MPAYRFSRNAFDDRTVTSLALSLGYDPAKHAASTTREYLTKRVARPNVDFVGDDAARDRQHAQRDDEGRDAVVGDPEAVPDADRTADQDQPASQTGDIRYSSVSDGRHISPSPTGAAAPPPPPAYNPATSDHRSANAQRRCTSTPPTKSPPRSPLAAP